MCVVRVAPGEITVEQKISFWWSISVFGGKTVLGMGHATKAVGTAGTFRPDQPFQMEV
jgi:hypothetical protein